MSFGRHGTGSGNKGFLQVMLLFFVISTALFTGCALPGKEADRMDGQVRETPEPDGKDGKAGKGNSAGPAKPVDFAGSAGEFTASADGLADEDNMSEEERFQWDSFFDVSPSDRSVEFERKACAMAMKLRKPGEKLMPRFFYADADFPDSGAKVMECSMMGDGYEIFLSVWVKALEDGTYEYGSNYKKGLLKHYLSAAGIEYYDPGEDEPGVGSTYNEIEDLKSSLIVCLGDYGNIPEFFTLFHKVCENMERDQKVISEDLNQTLKFMEANTLTAPGTLSDYMEWEIDFGGMDQRELNRLELAVSKEQLSLIEKTQPDRYRMIESGRYCSRADYLKPYELPSCSSYLVGSEDSQAYIRWGILTAGDTYDKYREYLLELEGRPREDVFGPDGELQFRYLGLEEAYAQFINDDGIVGYSYEWRALCSDLFYFEYPNRYRLGSSDSCGVMLYEFSGEPFAMQDPVNRLNDNGRMYVFVLPGRADEENWMEEVNDCIAPVINGTISWNPDTRKTAYHNFLCAEGETGLRSLSVFMPVMENGEDYHYIILFDIFKDSQRAGSLFSFRNHIMETFVMLPYWYLVQPGDTMKKIAKKYTGSQEAMWEISKDPLNKVRNPDRLKVNQRLEIPADLLHRKTRYD